jgi:hypothetical protein
MNPRIRIAIASLSVLLASGLVCGQVTPPPPASSNVAQPQTAKPDRKSVRAGRGAVDPLAAARRATAILLITSLAEEARGFSDGTLRARVQARAADALWATDAERARALFRRAWEAADVADRESLRRWEEEQRIQIQNGVNVFTNNATNLRGEVLRLAAKRERALGEEFLFKMKEARKQEQEAAALKTDAAPSNNPNDPATAAILKQRLELASQLLRDGDMEQAIQFAEPVLRRVDSQVMGFIVALRQVNATAADRIYARLLTGAAIDPASDANTISLLSSYIFTPGLFIEITRGGGYSVNQGSDAPAPENFPWALRGAFFKFAAQILLRPQPPADQDSSSSGRGGTYFMIARLLPLFEQYAPDKVPALQTQMSALTPDAPPQYRTEHPLLTKGLRPASTTYDAVQNALDKLGTAKTAAERDAIYVEAAFAAETKNDPRARDFADKIEHGETRRQLRAFFDYSDLAKAHTKNDAEEIVRLAKTGEIPSIQRVWAYTEAARLLLKTDRARTLEVLEEATNETRRIDGSDPDRARAMLAVATRLYELDPARVWTLMPDAVKTINAVSNFSGEDGRLVVRFQTRSYGSVRTGAAPNFNLQPLFALLAGEDMDRAVELARNFTAEAPRAVATLAIAVAVLKDKSQSKP